MDNNNKHPLWENIFRRKDDRITEICRLWSSTPLFKRIPQLYIRRLVKNMHPRFYKTNESIFTTGDIGAGAAIIKSGEINIMAGNNVLANLKAGDFFGEVSLVVDEPRTADAIASTDCELIFFLRTDLEEWVHSSPKQGAQLMANISRVLAGRLRHANDMLTEKNNSSSL
ncbi:MAG: cyclic nucleotide-binding domain-containing protein [Gammaproteobacteria bacterium]|nr:cyclic nucleotide-binding domain-containing protein [Gammaproteobacteria bacterium]